MTTPLEPVFWRNEEAILWDAVSRSAMQSLMMGLGNGIDALPAALQQLVSWDTVNQAALDWLQVYRFNQIGGINQTTMQATQRAIQQWIQAGNPLPQLIDALTPIYGAVRAEAIAVTEVTRIFAGGNQIAWEGTGVIGGKQWMTAVDERVCPLCRPLHMQTVALDANYTLTSQSVASSPAMKGLLGTSFDPQAALRRADTLLKNVVPVPGPPMHVRCRCWLQPFVSEVMFRERVGDILANRFFAEVSEGAIEGVRYG